MVDRLFPWVPVRQRVTTFPRRPPFHLAADPKLATEALRQVTRTIVVGQRRQPRRAGPRPSPAYSSGPFAAVQLFPSAGAALLHFRSHIPDEAILCDPASLLPQHRRSIRTSDQAAAQSRSRSPGLRFNGGLAGRRAKTS